MYLADCIFPDIESQLAAYKSFCELWDSGEMAKADKFPGFEMLFRVHAPGAGRVTRCSSRLRVMRKCLSTSLLGVLNMELKLISPQ